MLTLIGRLEQNEDSGNSLRMLLLVLKEIPSFFIISLLFFVLLLTLLFFSLRHLFLIRSKLILKSRVLDLDKVFKIWGVIKFEAQTLSGHFFFTICLRVKV